MRILITGSEGTLGKVLKAELRKRGHQVYGCDLWHTADPMYMRADIAERRQLERVFYNFKPHMVFHWAAEFGRANGQEFYEQLWKTGCIGTRNVIECCLENNAKMVFASSSEAYGKADEYAPPDEPFDEEWLDRYAPNFHNEYALSKWTAERQIRIAKDHHGLRAVILRQFNCYGPHEEFSPYRSVVCLFSYKLMHGLPITVYRGYSRVFMWVGDWVNTVANVANRFEDAEKFSAINVGGEEFISVEELKDRIIGALGGTTSSPITYLDAEKANVVSKRPNITIAKRILGHNPTTPLSYGLPKTIEWMRAEYSPERMLVEV